MKRNFTITEALEEYPVSRRIKEHFEDHYYLTRDDYARILEEETHKKQIQDMTEIYGELEINHTDLSAIT